MTTERAGAPVRTVFLGSGTFAVPALRALAAHPDIDVVGVVTAPPRAAGRGLQPTPTPIALAAGAAGFDPILVPDRLRAPSAIEAVLALEPDLVVLADYGQIVPAALLDRRHGALNLHPSLLPRYRGATPIPAAILAGDTTTGVTLMRMDAGLDTGPIVAQARHGLNGTETTPALEAALAQLGADLLATNLGPWIRDEREASPQPGDGVTLTRPLRREDGRLSPNRSSTELERQVRAYQPWPGSFIDTVVGRVVVWRADDVGARAGDGDPTPGRLGEIGLGARDGTCLAFREVQPAGGNRMPWDDFVRGRPSIVGSLVVEPADALR